ncbi:RHS repeat-associated core domain-containing protein [Pseudomonas monteilii]|uniref:RHS repeat-associated core domain-containing protein n=1 Tax=Pseudomonas monteilii TaxID=76759 RepID=UPI0037FF51C0
MTPKQQGIQHTNVTGSQSVKAAGNATLHFYQDGRFVSEKGAQGHRRVLWSNESAVAQLEDVNGTKPLQTDLAGSTLGVGLHYLTYSPYGHRAIDAMAALLGFNGQHPESLTGGYLLGNGHRMYSPILMRFHSADALSPFEEGGINAYAYCSGDPINFIDPSGRMKRVTTTKATIDNSRQNRKSTTNTQHHTYDPTARVAETKRPLDGAPTNQKPSHSQPVYRLTKYGELILETPESHTPQPANYRKKPNAATSQHQSSVTRISRQHQSEQNSLPTTAIAENSRHTRVDINLSGFIKFFRKQTLEKELEALKSVRGHHK